MAAVPGMLPRLRGALGLVPDLVPTLSRLLPEEGLALEALGRAMGLQQGGSLPPVLAAAARSLAEAGTAAPSDQLPAATEALARALTAMEQELKQEASGAAASAPPPVLPAPPPSYYPSRLRVCGNPRCRRFEGSCEADLGLKRCGGCRVALYCCTACQQQHWRGGHKAECVEVAAAAAGAGGGGGAGEGR